MTSLTKQIADMMEMLPESEQKLACAILKRLVQAWDPDVTKLTSVEAERFTKAKSEIYNNELVGHNDIDWS